MKRILGIDCSSTTIGYSILDFDDLNNINFVDVNYLKPIKDGNIIERISNTRDEFNNIINKYKPNYIGIEEIIKFMSGKSSANTVIMLTTFNRMIGLLSYDYLNRAPELFNVLSIRHALKINKIFPKKGDMPELVSKHLSIIFPYIYNKKGKLKEENNDMADAIAVALYYAFLLTGKIKKKTK